MSSLLAKSAKNFSPLYMIHNILHFSDSSIIVSFFLWTRKIVSEECDQIIIYLPLQAIFADAIEKM